MEAMTEKIIADVLRQGVASGAFTIGHVRLTASLIKPLLQDWYVKRAKYRRRGTSIEAYVATVTAFIDDALTPRYAEPRPTEPRPAEPSLSLQVRAAAAKDCHAPGIMKGPGG
jgi:hypothetical protein